MDNSIKHRKTELAGNGWRPLEIRTRSMKPTDRLPPVRVNRAYIRQRLMTAAEFALIRGQFVPAVKALELLKTMIDEDGGEQAPGCIEVRVVDGREPNNDRQ